MVYYAVIYSLPTSLYYFCFPVVPIPIPIPKPDVKLLDLSTISNVDIVEVVSIPVTPDAFTTTDVLYSTLENLCAVLPMVVILVRA